MTLDFAATFFASATLLLPIFATERLHVDARGYGFLAAAPAIGSVITALVMARIGSFRKEGRLVVVSVAIFGLATAAFGISTVFFSSLLARNRRRRYGEHGIATDDSPVGDAEPSPRTHDVD